MDDTMMQSHQELESYYLGAVDARSLGEERNIMVRMTAGESNRSGVSLRAAKPKMILLILEDFDEIRAFLAGHFTKQGYDVFSSATLRDALTLAREEPPSLIFIDYDLSDENAYHAIAQLRAMLPTSIIILMGGPGTIGIEERAKHAGASKVIDKTSDFTTMDEIVDRQKSPNKYPITKVS
jgi:ActR/RegA family two-component response regulator